MKKPKKAKRKPAKKRKPKHLKDLMTEAQRLQDFLKKEIGGHD